VTAPEAAGVTTPWERRGIVAILLLAAALRLSALDAGVPYAVGADEPFVMGRVMTMMKTGDFHPKVFDYPSLYLYVQTGVATLRYLVGTVRGEWFSLRDVSEGDFYLWARAVTATLGTLTVGLLWLVARRLSPAAGLTAALLLAIQPQHVRESHFVLTDVPVTFFVTLALLLSVRAAETGRRRHFAWAGAAVGLAAATKYNGAIALILPLLGTLWMSGRAVERAWCAAAALAGTAAGFLIAAPYTVLDLPAFLEGFGYLASSYSRTLPPDPPAWLLYLQHLRLNLGWPLFVVALLGVATALVRLAIARVQERTLVWAMAVVFVIAAYSVIARQNLVFGRYLLPLLPPLLLLAGGVLGMAWPALRRIARGQRRWEIALVVAIAAALAVPPLARTSSILAMMRKTTSNQIAYEWILNKVPAGSRVVVEAEGMLLPVKYQSRNVARLIDEPLSRYQADGVKYLVASSRASGGASQLGSTSPLAPRYRELFRQVELVFAVAPSEEHPGSEIRVLRVPEVPKSP
jgi:4-amino-4-deoxy-L-arabinose transferase-like glycosyltransferase